MLRRYERTRVLIEGDPSLAHEIVRSVEEECSKSTPDGDAEACLSVTVLDGPQEGLVMVQARETAKGTLFYLSEALMASCRVSFDGAVGYGFVLGGDRCLAYELAVIDAAFAGGEGARRAESWEASFAREREAIRARERRDAARVAATRVDFSTLNDGSAARPSEERDGSAARPSEEHTPEPMASAGSMDGK